MFKTLKVFCLSLVLTMFSLSTVTVTAENKEVTSFELIDMIINSEIDYGLSGAQLVVMHKGDIVKQSAYGYTNSYENIKNGDEMDYSNVNVIPRNHRNKVTNDTLFDLASNTKMYAGNYAIQYLITHGDLTLDTKVQDIFPEFTYQGIGVDAQSEMTIGHLLRHDSGFIASPKYHDNTFLGNLGNEGYSENWLYTQDENEILEKLLLTPIEYELGTKVRYSDVDFMLIGKIVEEVSQMKFDDFLKQNIYGPIGVDSVTFNPLRHGFTKEQTTSSELHGNTRGGRVFFNNPRTSVITGEVHDEKAFYSFDGLAGHAGLFGNATDVATLAQLMLDDGMYNNIEIFSQDTIDAIVQPSPLNDTYAYGWRRQGSTKAYGWAFSEYASANTIGHTGWTGTITQIDPDNELVVALFTNARNSPIMGPDKNDFYTKSFNTNDYGTITTLIYEELGLGSNTTATEFIIDKIESSKQNTASERNSLRALYTVLKELALTDNQAKDYILYNLEDAMLNESFLDDTKHLDITHLTSVNKEHLNNLIIKLSDKDIDDSILDYAKLISNDLTATQQIVDESFAELKLIDTEEPVVEIDISELQDLLNKVKNLDKTKYSVESYNAVKDLADRISLYLQTETLDQPTIDNYVFELGALINQLETLKVESPSVPNTGINPKDSLFFGVIGSCIISIIILVKRKKQII